MFTCASERAISLVVLQEGFVSLGDETFKLLECSVYIVILVENLVFLQ